MKPNRAKIAATDLTVARATNSRITLPPGPRRVYFRRGFFVVLKGLGMNVKGRQRMLAVESITSGLRGRIVRTLARATWRGGRNAAALSGLRGFVETESCLRGPATKYPGHKG